MKMSDAALDEATFRQGVALHQQGRLGEAEMLYRRVLQAQPRHFYALHQLGLIAIQTNHPQSAAELIAEAIRIDSRHAAVHLNHGIAQALSHRFEAALASIDRAIGIDPNAAEAHYNRGNVLRELKRSEAAIASYERAIALKPDHGFAHNNRALTLCDLGRREAAVAGFDRAIAAQPRHSEVHYNRGNALRDLRQFEAALASYDRAIALEPNHAFAHNNRGLTLHGLGRYQPALASFDRAIAANGSAAEARYNRANALRELRRYESALVDYDRAIELKPDYAEAHNNRGLALALLNRHEAAVASFDRAIALQPDSTEAYNNRGLAYAGLGRFAAALASFDLAIAKRPDYADACYNRGNTLAELQQFELAILNYEQALSFNPDFRSLRGLRLHTRMLISDWRDWKAENSRFTTGVAQGEETTNPFFLLGLSGSASTQLKAAQAWVREQCPADPGLGPIPKRAKQEKIRIGYFSADYHAHATAYLMAGLFELHDRSRFEVTAFSFGAASPDEMRRRLVAGCENFIDVRGKSDREVALLARSLQIDIAVDLKGFTKEGRPGIFALRAAPLQVSYLGYPGTMGAGYMDYLIADDVLVPEQSRTHYAEKIIYLPHSYQVNDAKRDIADKPLTRGELGLPESAFVFCCFNNSYKITPDTFDRWMRILLRTPDSVLWLFEDNPQSAGNLRREAELRGVAPERLHFARRMALPEHLARHRAADLFIDTLPYNAHTTASDALWAGLPVLTYAGEAFAGRVAASLLGAVGLPELVARDLQQYEELAVELATQPRRMTAIRRKLEENRLTMPLFDTRLFTTHLESAYATIYERHHAGQPVEHLRVKA